MMIKNKYILLIATGLFIIMAGVFYSCSYGNNKGQEILLTSESNQGHESNDSGLHDDTDQSLAINWQDNNKQSDNNELQVHNNQELIYVHICGAVFNPDVYQIEDGSRLIDVIELAGGLCEDAAGDFINQARIVEDGQRIYIPTKEELNEISVSDYLDGEKVNQEDNQELNGKVNINTADETELMTLTGIGQAKARSIIEYRNKNGKFSDITDLMKIPGIKEGLFAQIENEITIGNNKN